MNTVEVPKRAVHCVLRGVDKLRYVLPVALKHRELKLSFLGGNQYELKGVVDVKVADSIDAKFTKMAQITSNSLAST